MSHPTISSVKEKLPSTSMIPVREWLCKLSCPVKYYVPIKDVVHEDRKDRQTCIGGNANRKAYKPVIMYNENNLHIKTV